MTNKPIDDAVKQICDQDGMGAAYRTRLSALIKNAMRDSIDRSDIEDLLAMIEVKELTDED